MPDKHSHDDNEMVFMPTSEYELELNNGSLARIIIARYHRNHKPSISENHLTKAALYENTTLLDSQPPKNIENLGTLRTDLIMIMR